MCFGLMGLKTMIGQHKVADLSVYGGEMWGRIMLDLSACYLSRQGFDVDLSSESRIHSENH